jgi:DNA-directed RNA polymerase specialized sigma24 family protein
MDISISRALLLQIVGRLTADDTFLGRLRGRARRRALILSLKHLLEEGGRTKAAPDLVAATRRYWEADDSVRIDDPARQRIDRDGIWLSGWVRARTGVTAFDCIDPVRLASAIAALPALSRQVFLLHAHGDLDYGRIAARLGMSTGEVQDELAGALLALDTALHNGGDILDSDDGKPIA